MYKVRLEIATLSPVLIAKRSGLQVLTETKTHIPGSMIRGLLATQFIRIQRLGRKAHENEAFYHLFLSGAVRFLPAYPCSSAGLTAQPAPRCLQQEKGGGAVYDLTDPVQRGAAAGCKSLRGFVGLTPAGERVRISSLNPTRRIRFHLLRGSTQQDASVFNYEALDEGQHFQAELIGTQEDLAALCRLLPQEATAQLGRSKQVQYGTCRWRLGVPEPLTPLPAAWPDVLALVAYTPLLLVNEWGMSEPSPQLLARAISEQVGMAFTVEASFAATEDIEQFVGIWGMRRPCQQAIAAGSVVTLKPADAWTPQLWHRLHALLADGVGIRRAEGFGQLRLLTTAATYEPQALSQPLATRPPGEMPALLRQILEEGLQAQLREAVVACAWRDARSYAQVAAGEVGTGLAAKIEATLAQAADPTAFRTAITAYPAHTSSQLRSLFSRSKKMSLFKLLTAETLPYEEVDSQQFYEQWTLECQLLDSDVTLIEEWKQALFTVYWQNFCRHLRKEIQQCQRNGGNEHA